MKNKVDKTVGDTDPINAVRLESLHTINSHFIRRLLLRIGARHLLLHTGEPATDVGHLVYFANESDRYSFSTEDLSNTLTICGEFFLIEGKHPRRYDFYFGAGK